MKAIVSIIGRDKKGIIAKASNLLYNLDVNVEDISQTILQDYFTMIMVVDISQSSKKIKEISDALNVLAKEIGVEISIKSSEIFDCMHKI